MVTTSYTGTTSVAQQLSPRSQLHFSQSWPLNNSQSASGQLLGGPLRHSSCQQEVASKWLLQEDAFFSPPPSPTAHADWAMGFSGRFQPDACTAHMSPLAQKAAEAAVRAAAGWLPNSFSWRGAGQAASRCSSHASSQVLNRPRSPTKSANTACRSRS